MTAAVRQPCCLQAEGQRAAPLWRGAPASRGQALFPEAHGAETQSPDSLTPAPTPSLGRDPTHPVLSKAPFLCSVLGPVFRYPPPHGQGLGKIRAASPQIGFLRDQKGGMGDDVGRYHDDGKEDWLVFSKSAPPTSFNKITKCQGGKDFSDGLTQPSQKGKLMPGEG